MSPATTGEEIRIDMELSLTSIGELDLTRVLGARSRSFAARIAIWTFQYLPCRIRSAWTQRAVLHTHCVVHLEQLDATKETLNLPAALVG